jgi:hypothetical protein
MVKVNGKNSLERPPLRFGGGSGPTTKWKSEYIDQAEKLSRLGATDDELADFFGVSVATITNWKHHHPAFFYALKLGKQAADDRVERSLYTRAVGYVHDDVKIFLPKGATTPEEAVVVPFKRHVPPDVVACIFWLKNRRQSEWRDKHEHSHKVETDTRTPEQLLAEIAVQMAEAGLLVTSTTAPQMIDVSPTTTIEDDDDSTS